MSKSDEKLFGGIFILVLLAWVTVFSLAIWGAYELIFAVVDYLGRH
jgi:hypothetical protein